MNPVSYRLDWRSLWDRYEARVAEIRQATDAYGYTFHVSSQARQEIEQLVEEFVSAREAALQ